MVNRGRSGVGRDGEEAIHLQEMKSDCRGGSEAGEGGMCTAQVGEGEGREVGGDLGEDLGWEGEEGWHFGGFGKCMWEIDVGRVEEIIFEM